MALAARWTDDSDSLYVDIVAHQCFWRHLEMFPEGRCISRTVIQNIQNELGYLIVGEYSYFRVGARSEIGSDQETSSSSTACYSTEDLRRFQVVFKGINLNSETF